ncbi:MAG: GNAT family N-acetyltransferase, partial [Planctomycetota bacterium]
MAIEYSAEKTAADLDKAQVQELFDSVDWPHAQVPDDLMKALAHSEVLITAWDDGKLIGLANAVGDGTFHAYIHWLIV